jgi:hypothetical protein
MKTSTHQKGSTSLIIIVIVLLVLALGFMYFAGFNPLNQNQTKPVISNAAPITIDQLTNATIPDFIGVTADNSTITFVNGKYAGAPVQDSGTGYEVDLNSVSTSYASGDLNADGSSDLVVTMVMNGGGTGSFTYLVAFANNNGTPKFVDGESLGDRIKVNQISINNGIISADIITQGPGEPMCCGTLREVVKYKLSEGKLVEITPTSDSSGTSQSNGSTDTDGNPIPVISSISPLSGIVGTTLTITGNNLNGFEGDRLVTFTNNENGQTGVLDNYDVSATAPHTITIVIPAKICTVSTGLSGKPCPSYIQITPGVYSVSVTPWGTESNKVQFAVK